MKCFQMLVLSSLVPVKVSCQMRAKVRELHLCAAAQLTPHPDAILAIAWSLRVWGGAAHCGIIIFDTKAAAAQRSGGCAGQAPHTRGRVVCASEAEAIRALQLLVEEVDPDVVCGFDIQRGSIGYILDRCAHIK